MQVRPLWHRMIARALPDGISVTAIDDLRREGNPSNAYAIADDTRRVHLRYASIGDRAAQSSPLEHAA